RGASADCHQTKTCRVPAAIPTPESPASASRWQSCGRQSANRSRSWVGSVIRLRRQTGPPLDEIDDRIDRRVAQRRDKTLGGLPSDRINLDEFEFAARGDDFAEPVAERLLL